MHRLLFLFFAPLALLGAELRFPAGKPVTQTVRKTITHISSPESVEERIELNVEAEVSVSGSGVDSVLTAPPFDLSLTLKQLNVDMKTEEGNFSFDSASPGNSIFLAQFGELIEHPLHINVKKGFNLEPETPKIVRTLQELPEIQDLRPENFIQDFFYYQFALAGEDLEEGKSYVRPLPQESGGILFEKITYTIEKIDDKFITAKISSETPKKKRPVAEPFNSDNEAVTDIIMTLDGTIEGKVRWDRRNSLCYALNTIQTYEGRFDVLDEEVVMKFKVDHEVHSR